jgi:Tfp pilus assembly protein PilF
MNFVRWLTLSTLAASVVWGAEAPSIEGAMAFMRTGDSTNAIATLSAFLKEKPEDVRAWHLRAQMRGLTGDAEGAISDFESLQSVYALVGAVCVAMRSALAEAHQ